ncbi:hypothetical protein [Pseudomonas gingeri]|uniref:Transmembrane protein n=1 Tax=Pseudomonas gingeri TaxID=117681 RepID=A0A7Y8BMW8_9PSED|nr:hypothetical protein [Pseudomonas gingeri]NWB49545.1 hypothetical protein [Pseudomonas gingeri]
MGGWQRLWVLVSFLLAIGAVVLGFHNMETESELDAWHDARRGEYVSEINNLQRKATGTKPLNISGDSKRTIDELWGRVTILDSHYQQDIEELSARQIRHVSIYLAAWVAICIGLYAIGWLTAWVVRGFRSKAV